MPRSSSRPRLYWMLQMGGWGAYGLLGGVLSAVFGRFKPIIIPIEIIVAGAMLLGSHLLRLYLRRRGWTQLPLVALLPRLLLGNLLVAVGSMALTGVLVTLLYWVVEPHKNSTVFPWLPYVGYTANSFFFMLLWSAAYFSLHYFDNLRQAEIEKWKLEAAVREAEMRTLKAQINPHFLFNGLNNIRALVLENPVRAREMMTHLSDLLRYSLQLNTREQVPLARELEIVAHYLTLENLQLEERLRFTLDVAPATLEVLLPPMTLQLLVENAIKHGIAPRPGGGDIRISAQLERPGQVLITVRNPGRYQPNPAALDHTGIGLPNAHERLQLLFGPTASLVIGDDARQANTVTAELRLPLLTTTPALTLASA
ncbi:sensor histidine kinase [Hymenobacter negativus]|uniref:Histidine kinase n=1 Tax=Hymenobacter negativus TaxID=2795026 RepID=A0ABS0QB16_9BACT|nr:MULTISPECIES: histidine kinase [Bacteria]MBH8559404.1 histidine kinase [Hymenobacter negativus]MBH8568336.1 histidine kinase [Hymenobacter negativus]MBR7208071.1 histidine kinase [Microvirga sp. STS02]